MLNTWEEGMLPQLGLCFGFLSGDISIGCFATAVGRGFNYGVYGSGTLDAAIFHNPKSLGSQAEMSCLILYSVLHLRVLLAITFVALC